MGIEIERKFLVNKALWLTANKPKGNLLQQGYLSTEAARTIRVRLTDTQGFLTIKGITTNATRQEFEYEIPVEDATQLLKTMATSKLTKIRYNVRYKNHLWEVDEFLDDNAGLLIAEIELSSEEEEFEKPQWVDKEVTNDTRYYNSNLCLHPYKDWGRQH